MTIVFKSSLIKNVKSWEQEFFLCYREIVKVNNSFTNPLKRYIVTYLIPKNIPMYVITDRAINIVN